MVAEPSNIASGGTPAGLNGRVIALYFIEISFSLQYFICSLGQRI
jgi:hypothetical protein